MLDVIYTIKACMLILYTRLTLTLPHRRLVKYLAIYVLCGWLSTQTAFFTACRPFNGYWAMPPPTPQCTTLQHYAIIQASFNISSDLLMLSIPLPMILKLRLPWKQKGVLIAIFSLGLFVVTAAILTKVFNLSNVWDPSYMLWYTRESSVAVYVSNLPLIWPLVREWFPSLRALTPGQKNSSEKKATRSSRLDLARTRMAVSPRFGSKIESGVVTVIKGKGDSMDGLREEGLEFAESHWSSDEEGSGGIHTTTVVQMSAYHVGEMHGQMVQIPESVLLREKDLEMGEPGLDARGMKKWSSEKLDGGGEQLQRN